MSAAASVSAGGGASGTAQAPERADLTAWLGVAAGSLGSLMAALDISIVNSSMPTIQGEIGASSSEGTWIATAYLVSEIIIIPLTGWLERMLGLRRFLLIAAVLFTGFSVMCGLSTTLTMMIIGRVGQGFTGGAMIPTAMTIIATRLPRSQQPIGTAMFGATVILGPVMGPLAGGWLTENLSWHYAFFINVPVCGILMILLLVGLPNQRMRLDELADADWLGIAGMALGLGGLTIVLEEGHREQWFESSLILWLTVVTFIGFALVAAGQLLAKRPVIKLALMRNGGFASVIVMGFVLGAVLYGSSFVIPQFLAAVAGYNALQSGQVVLLAGIPAMLMMPLLPMLIARADARLMIALGFLIMAASCWFDSSLSTESTGGAFSDGQLLRGLGQSFCMMFLNQSAISSVAPRDAGDASGLFNAARNLGGSICLALLATLQDQRLEFHRWTLHSAIQANDPAVQTWVASQSVTGGVGPDGLTSAYMSIDSMVSAQALVMAYSDDFVAMTIGILIVVPLVLLLKPLPKGQAPMAAH
ncbi:MAG TPA: DHA2 family efflux MFS transporter permease subunit [Sphingobium sp.]|uniref:DHA2 family efflux MFS transporter permease subunit n=1 Tax=Sphingobium sp. TaxID=1912891 RepID=UPI002ED5333C